MSLLPTLTVAESARPRIGRRLLPFLWLLYVLAFLDRMNVAYDHLEAGLGTFGRCADLPGSVALRRSADGDAREGLAFRPHARAALPHRGPTFLGGASLSLAIASIPHIWTQLVFFVIFAACLHSHQPPFWALPATILSQSVATASVGLISSIGNPGVLWALL